MAGQSGRNLSIAKSKLGAPQFPFERPDAGNGYAASGPCLVRKMTKEERVRYGPAVIPTDRSLTRGEVSFAVKNATSLEHAARLARVSAVGMKKEMARHCVAVPEEWKEDKTVDDIDRIVNDNRENPDGTAQEGAENQENQAPGVDEKQEGADKVVHGQSAFYEGSGGRRFTAKRIARAEEDLSREEYIRLKNEVFERTVLQL